MATSSGKVGNRGDTLTWAEYVAQVAQGYFEWITQLTRTQGASQEEFQQFFGSSPKNLNPSIDVEKAIHASSAYGDQTSV
ncbi:MAG: hypothetical protein LBT86_01670 [Deltaproteobacteria bacterium]|jgi:predicted helicase|nr:hypothetical protein [Deltaproteobacteria bacterium]